jgi:hypothetical protein
MSGSNIWDQVLARVETVNRHSYYTGADLFLADQHHSAVRVPDACPRLAEQALRRVMRR